MCLVYPSLKLVIGCVCVCVCVFFYLIFNFFKVKSYHNGIINMVVCVGDDVGCIHDA